MNNVIYERACEILQSSKLKLTFTKLHKLIVEEFPLDNNVRHYNQEVGTAKDWYDSLVHYSFPKNSDAFIYFEKHQQPILIDSEHGTIWRLNKNGSVKPTPLDLSKKYNIQYLYNNIDKSFTYFNIGTYNINEKEVKNHLPIRLQKISTTDDLRIEFYYQNQWLDLFLNETIYNSYLFKDININC